MTIELGFDLVQSGRPQDFSDETLSEFSESPINTKYIFAKDNRKISLFYKVLPNSLVTVTKTAARELRPDFTLEIERNGSEKVYIILDAKYKKISNIQNYDYQELVLKYLQGIGHRSGGYLPILGLFILNPINASGINYYQKSFYTSLNKNMLLPLIGRVEMSINGSQVNYFKEVLTLALNKSLQLRYA